MSLIEKDGKTKRGKERAHPLKTRKGYGTPLISVYSVAATRNDGKD